MDKKTMRVTKSVTLFNQPVLLLVVALFMLIMGSWLAYKQKPKADVFAPVSLIDPLLYPIEENAFQRLPKIASNLINVFTLPNSDLVWVTSIDGLILHSQDGGQNWQQQYPSKPSDTTVEIQQSLLDLLIKPSVAADAEKLNPIKNIRLNKQSVQTDISNQQTVGELKKDYKFPDQQNQITQQQEQRLEQINKTQIKKTVEVLPALHSIHFVDANQGWAVGESGTILHTKDGGQSWKKRASATKEVLIAVHFVNAQQGWVVGSNGIILHTANGGESWQQQAKAGDIYLGSIDMIDAQQGWSVGGRGTILHTSNGGRDWQLQNSGTREELNSVRFITTQQGWAVGAKGTILHTKDGGKNWQAQKTGLQVRLHSISFVDERRVWVVGSDGTVLSTVDGGINWQSENMDTEVILHSVSFINAKRGWAVGNSGLILYTFDGGENWEPQSIAYNQWFYAVDFTDSRRGWVTGTNGNIMHTDDGGDSWQVQITGTKENLVSVNFVNSLQGWSVGDKGLILHTTNGGKNWQQQTSHIKTNLRSVNFINAKRGWAVGEGGIIIHTDDGGKNWQAQSSRTKVMLESVNFVDAQHGWVVDVDGNIRFTTDGGSQWHSRNSGSKFMLRSVDFIDRQKGWASGDGQMIRHTTDGGKNWVAQNSAVKAVFSSVSFIDAQRGWLSGSEGTILHTKDAGAHWQAQESDTRKWLNAIKFIDAQHGWAVGRQNTIISTQDGGKTWISSEYKKYPAGWYYLLCIGLAVLCWRAYKLPQKQLVAQETITDLLASDRPLQQGDPDPLGFNDIAHGLSRFLRNSRTEPPLTLAVTGEWGSGKSSLMNLLFQDLQDKGFSTVWFNAWHHQKSEQLLASLFANIRSQAIPGWFSFSGLRPIGLVFRWRLLKIRSQQHRLALLIIVLVATTLITLSLTENNQLSQVQLWIDFQLNRLGEKMKIITGIGTSLTAFAALLFGLGKSMQSFAINPLNLMTMNTKNGLKAAAVDPGARYQFAREFSHVTQSMDLGRMIIFIDDLDRCGKENVLEILEAINFLVSSGDCYIILGMAPEWVKICVGLGFKELAEESHAESNNGQANQAAEHRRQFASQYLEKLINIEVPVPVLDENKAQLLTVPEVKQVELNTYNKLWRTVSGLLEQHRMMVAVIIFIILGIAAGQYQYPMIIDQQSSGEKSAEQHLIQQWPADELRWLQETKTNELLSKIIEIDKQSSSKKTPQLEWQLKTDKRALEKGLLVQTFADGKVNLVLKQVTHKAVPEQKNTGKTKEQINQQLANKDDNNSKIAFQTGQQNQSSWHRFIPYFLVLPIIAVASFVVFRKPGRVMEDSKSFREAMTLWQPYLMLRNQSPRKIKRFLNHLRYLAMRYRVEDEPVSLWETVMLGEKTIKPESEQFSEPALVAMSVLYYIDPSWVIDAKNFAMINELKVGEATTHLSFDNPIEESRLIKQLQKTVQRHLQMFKVDVLASHQQREMFLVAQGLDVD